MTTITLTDEERSVVKRALDVYMRLSIGQLHVLSALADDEVLIPFVPSLDGERPTVSGRDVAAALLPLYDALSTPLNGGYGLHHPHVHPTALVARSAFAKLP